MSFLIYFTLVMIFFPVHIQIMGKDALTTGSASIIILTFVFVVKSLVLTPKKLDYWLIVLLLFVIAVYSSTTVTGDHLGSSVRHMTEFLSSIMFFFIVVNYINGQDLFLAEDQTQYIEKLISFLLVMVAIQSIIGILLYFKPEYGKLFSLFATRDKDTIEMQFDFTSNIKRLGCLIGGGEQFGELLAVIFPLQFYKFYTDKNKIFNLVLLFLFVLVILLTATRSAIVLSIFSTMAFIFFNMRTIKYRRLIPLFCIIVLSIIILPYLFPEKFNDIIVKALGRFGLISSNQGFVSAINRESVWLPAFNDLSQNINFFGNGMAVKFNYHCLYLTVIYKLGVVGSAIFFFMLLKIFISLTKAFRKLAVTDRELLLITALLLSFSSLMINEVKFEFIRQASHQQIMWFVLALCAAAPEISLKSKIRDNA